MKKLTCRGLMDQMMSPEEREACIRSLVGKRVVYLCMSMDDGIDAYIKKAMAIAYCMKQEGCVVFAPYIMMLNLYVLNNPMEGARYIREWADQMMDRCDEFWVVNEKLDSGMLLEFQRAVSIGTHVKCTGKQNVPIYHISLKDPETNQKALKKAINEHIMKTLGESAIAYDIVFTDKSLPLTANGKLDPKPFQEEDNKQYAYLSHQD